MNCCCQWGAAVSGEYPEFPCWDCPMHGHDTDLASPAFRCKRHSREFREAL